MGKKSRRKDSKSNNAAQSTILSTERELAPERIFKFNISIETILNDQNDVDANYLLYELSKRGSIKHMEELVNDHGADVNALSELKYSYDPIQHRAPPLFGAVDGSSVTAVEWLLKHGADPSHDCFCFAEDYAVTPLWVAAENGNVRMGKLLLDHGADVNAAKTSTRNTPLHMAVQNNHPAMVSLLLRSGADPNQRNVFDQSPLDISIAYAYPRLVAQLINGGASVGMEALVMLGVISANKVTTDESQREISELDLDQMRALLTNGWTLQLCLYPLYAEAQLAEKNGDYRRALEILRSCNKEWDDEDYPCQQFQFDIDRVIEAIYGVKGSDCTISVWESVPIMTQTEPTLCQDYAWTQVGRKIYRHGGHTGHYKPRELDERDELWELDIDTRVWVLRKAEGESPGRRKGHTMWGWKNALYVWGGRTRGLSHFDTKLYRLELSHHEHLQWEVVKTKLRPSGREHHAGVLYRGKYYITAGNIDLTSWELEKDTWVLDMTNFKWSMLEDGPVERYCHGMWAANDKLYVLGGRRFHKEFLHVRPHRGSHSIESFVSYDICSKTWSFEPVIGDRPFDLSEFMVLPLYKSQDDASSMDRDNSSNGSDNDDASSVIICGGYHEFDQDYGPTKDEMSESTLRAIYGDEWEEFQSVYISRMLRFYPDTMVFKKLTPMTRILPKAQCFAAEIKANENCGTIELLIGGGYGFTAESMEKSEKINGQQCSTPKMSNEVFSVMTGELGSDCYLALVTEGKTWACQFCSLAESRYPHYLADVSPYSPILHHATDATHEDFQEPPCESVAPNNIKEMLGVRVELPSEKKGRIISWREAQDKYEIFIPKYEGGPITVSVKAQNLKRAASIKCEEILQMTGNYGLTMRFPTIYMTLITSHKTNEVKRHVFDQLLNPVGTTDSTEFWSTTSDWYYGPLSRQAQAIMRKLSDQIQPDLLGCMLKSPYLRGTKEVDRKMPEIARRNMELYIQFVNDLKAKDCKRVIEFEERVSCLTDAAVEKCGDWLRVKVSVDGLVPSIWREVLVSPSITMQSFHNQVLCPVMGWKNYNHCYAFRRISAVEYECSMFVINQGKSLNDVYISEPESIYNEVWIGPKKSNALDTMFLPLYIGGCMANDKNIRLGQLFSLDNDGSNKLFLQWVNDIGDWWSHSICVTKFDEDCGASKIPADATVAHLVNGEGGCIPEDAGGIPKFGQTLLKLIGKMASERGKCRESYISPCSEEWWTVFNAEFRAKSNSVNFLSNPNSFDYYRACANLKTEIYRPCPKDINEGLDSGRTHAKSGLTWAKKQCTISTPKKPTDVCAYCNVTVALKRCTGCLAVSYCSEEHSILNWPNHKTACRKAKRKQKKREQKNNS